MGSIIKVFFQNLMTLDFWDIFRGRDLLKESIEFKNRHKEWVDLSQTERKQLPKKEWPEYVMFKNTSPYYSIDNCDDYVSNYRYQVQILPRLNKLNFAGYGSHQDAIIFSDKNYMDVFMDSLLFPHILIRNIGGVLYDAAFRHISQEKALSILGEYDECVFKESLYSGHGSGVSLVPKGKYKDALRKFEKNYICEERVRQHEFLSNFNDSSVNIIRLTTLFWKEDVMLLSSILRIGAPGAFCDHLEFDGEGPRYMQIKDDGTLCGRAYDTKRGLMHDDCYGRKIKGKIPKWDDMTAMVLRAHEKYPHFGLIGWDMTVSESGEVLCIEYNVKCPDVVKSEVLCGPIFAKKTKRGSSCLKEIMQTPKDYKV